MRRCRVCNKEFESISTGGRPPEICSPECVAARRRQQRVESKQRASMRKCPAHLHGTSTGYTYFGCRCDRCRAWSRIYQKKRRAVTPAAS